MATATLQELSEKQPCGQTRTSNLGMGIFFHLASPYVRIPMYTYCPRTSSNWRRPTLSLHRRCHMSFLPFFGEDGYEDESHFRDRIQLESKNSSVKIVFTIPSELEEPSQFDPEDLLSTIPKDSVCAVCLSVGCIMHHDAPAVKQPTLDDEDPLKGALPLSSVSGTSGSTGSRWRRKSRDRSHEGCGKECIIVFKRRNAEDDIPEHMAFSQWSTEDKEELSTVLAAVGETIAASPAPSCLLSSYLSRRSCIDVSMAMQTDKILAQYAIPGLNGNGHLPSPELPDSDSNHTASAAHNSVLDKHRSKRAKTKDHEDARQRDVAAGHKNIDPFEDKEGEFSAAELRMRVPRAVLPWSPCHHPGKPCSSFTGKEDSSGVHCTCRRNGTWCEPGCGCPVDCSERFPGCDCAKFGKECRLSQEDSKGNKISGCPCQEHFRECHVEVCAGHDDKKCRLMSLQDDRAIRTFISTSELEGYGLFIGEDTNQTRVYLGEYKGELINENEATMRSLLYQTRGRSFLFDLNKLGVVDGIRLGNKTRYMNTSRQQRNNARGASAQVNGEARLLIHAQKESKSRLQRNDELLLDYGANFETF
ncbi:SET domain-containing protein [Cystobasidium minutum MCA 4210]|uniref:SET domain-containing protein n=1 Tax=Cystobasidium minutum MCA 4210 TaxID=1397322 RepID=UPI0034D0190D|eukprot:jgi/Rhomi1/7072/CE7071_1469